MKETISWKIDKVQCVTSTNDVLRQRAKEGCPSGSVLIAEEQSAGKGQHGHTFLSQKGGLYFSFLLRNIPLEIGERLTALCGAVLADVLRNKYHIDAWIKWVNDIYVDGGKVAGILTEGYTIPKTTEENAFIVGIGINVDPVLFPKELYGKAAYLKRFCQEVQKNCLCLAFLEELSKVLQSENRIEETMRNYKAYSCVLGKHVLVKQQDESFNAYVQDILPNGNLVVINEKQEKMILSIGEISLEM